ncbi:MAG: LysR family transcriptional regulator [Proteobacteria bacterium]|nr:MAG: LysR family transcriptional regulator [Pseudomonadota bacterium]
MTTWLNYHHLYYFRTIANEGSIARAAEKLRLGQPTLSAQLKTLEESLGIALFDRKHKKLILTEQGRMALEYANEIFRLGSEMIEVLQDKSASTRVHLAVGALDSVPKNVILALTKAAYKIGNCTVSVLEGKGDELLRELALHRIDLMIANYIPSITEMEKIRSRRLAQVPVLVCGAPQFKGLRKNFPRSLHGAPFVLPTRHSKLRHDLDHYFRSHAIWVDPVAETQDTSFQKLLGVAGVGLIPAPLFAVDELLEDKSLVEIGRLPDLSEEIYLMSASRKIENPVARKLFENFKLA